MSTIVFIVSCQKDEEIKVAKETKYQGVEPSLIPYFERFEFEASARGFQVDLSASGITGELVEIEDRNVAGRCSYNHYRPNHISMDLTFWESSGQLSREFFVFHELGHCYLQRDHEESKFASGVCKSIMRSGLEDCMDYYNTNTREYFIDELFGVEDRQ